MKCDMKDDRNLGETYIYILRQCPSRPGSSRLHPEGVLKHLGQTNALIHEPLSSGWFDITAHLAPIFSSSGARRSSSSNEPPSPPSRPSTFGKGIVLFAAGLAASSSTEPTYGSPEDFQAAISELRAIFKDSANNEDGEVEVSTDPDDLEVHGFSDNDYHPSIPPSVIVYPMATQDVVQIVQVATKYKMPIIAYSGATSLEGHFRGHATGGICLDMSRMDKILAIHENDADMVCQPGARWMDINSTLADMGIPLFWPIDPAPGATIGGLMSTGCSGTNATVVLPNGKVMKTRQRARKSSTGWDATKLFIGAEGTLGIVTEVTIRLAPVLPTTVAIAQFPSVRHATSAVQEILQSGVGIQCVELVDGTFMKAANAYGVVSSGSSGRRKYPEVDSLFFKLQGPTQRSLEETSSIVKSICKKYGGTGYSVSKNAEESEDMWSDRKNAHYSGLAMIPGAKGWATDVCVPVSNLPQLVAETKEDLDSIGLTSTIFVKAKGAVDRMVWRAIALDGTCTGEHGVGLGKKKYLIQELGIETVEFMKSIKRAVDPLGLFNPGKLYPDIEDSVFAPKAGADALEGFEQQDIANKDGKH
ncbi:hypothetical protein BKA70DRAFT_1453559 [Coprinopsis sp. MPI-PUGE-AT-0042]|nr:hypothetical protein BKA70DRAFT_1453559 [Coprinopsis sp. MPI-PUGE-AT-0042]